MSFDDVTKQLSLFVDGQQVATTTANLTIGYENDTEVFIAGPSTKFNGELGIGANLERTLVRQHFYNNPCRRWPIPRILRWS